MKKSSPFTLGLRASDSARLAAPIRRPKDVDSDTGKSKGVTGAGGPSTSSTKAVLGELKAATLDEVGYAAISNPNAETIDRAVLKVLSSARLKRAYSNLDENFKEALRNSLTTKELRDDGRVKSVEVNPQIKDITEDLAREDRVRRVAIIDFGSWVGGLPLLMERLNKAQSMFTLFEIVTPLPAGLVKTPQGFRDWVKAQWPSSLRKLKVAGAKPQMIFEDFYIAAENIRLSRSFDIVVVLTPYRVAAVDSDEKLVWDLFMASDENVALLSTDDVRRYAEEANRPFEAAVGMLLVASLFTAVNEGLNYHKIDTGCIFDYNDDRDSLKASIANLAIDNDCLALMAADEVQAAKSMLTALKKMKRRNVE